MKISGNFGFEGGGGGGSGNTTNIITPVTFNAQNKDSVLMVKGSPVAGHSSGSGMVRADGSNATLYCIGLLTQDTDVGFASDVLMKGGLQLLDWTLITGTVTLQAKGNYFLDATSGKLSLVPLQNSGQISQLIGIAIDSVTMELFIQQAILL